MSDKSNTSEARWREILTPEQFEVLREKGTERAFTGAYCDAKEPGTYRCAGCGESPVQFGVQIRFGKWLA